MNIKTPCMNCTDREIGCHSTCFKYKEYRDLVDKSKEELIKAKKLYNEQLSYAIMQREKARKSHR